MKRFSTERRHFDARTALDYLEGVLSAAKRRQVEEHLAGPCTPCRDRLREVGRLFEAMRTDRTPDVPDALRERVLRQFMPGPAVAAEAPAVWGWAALIFDSLQAPQPAAVRRSVGEARRLSFALDQHRLELELELDAPGSVAVRGRLSAPDPALHRIELMVANQSYSIWVGADGSFAIDRVPPGALTLTVQGPAGRFRFPSLEP